VAKLSYATNRKIRILKEKLGDDWREQYPGKSIDFIYNAVIGDNRKNLFCKVSPDVKDQVDEMVEGYDIKMSELIEKLVNEEHERYKARANSYSKDLANQFINS